jgi:hypothetical protein
MFNDEQLKVLKRCLDNKYGENLISIREFDNSGITQIQKDVDSARVENQIINQINNILTNNYDL